MILPTAARRFPIPDPEHSLRKLQQDFLISPGTQVVVKTAETLPGGEGHKPAGSVGVVVEAPASNREAYQVQFADGVVVKVQFAELTLRRGNSGRYGGHFCPNTCTRPTRATC